MRQHPVYLTHDTPRLILSLTSALQSLHVDILLVPIQSQPMDWAGGGELRDEHFTGGPEWHAKAPSWAEQEATSRVAAAALPGPAVLEGRAEGTGPGQPHRLQPQVDHDTAADMRARPVIGHGISEAAEGPAAAPQQGAWALSYDAKPG